DVMTREVITVPATMTLRNAAAFLTAPDTPHPSFPVVDARGQVLGVLDPPSVLAWRREGKHRRATLGELLEGRRVPVVHADDILENVANRLMSENVAHFPV